MGNIGKILLNVGMKYVEARGIDGVINDASKVGNAIGSFVSSKKKANKDDVYDDSENYEAYQEAYNEAWNQMLEKVYKSLDNDNFSGAESQLKNFYREVEEDPDYYYFKILADIYTQWYWHLATSDNWKGIEKQINKKLDQTKKYINAARNCAENDEQLSTCDELDNDLNRNEELIVLIRKEEEFDKLMRSYQEQGQYERAYLTFIGMSEEVRTLYDDCLFYRNKAKLALDWYLSTDSGLTEEKRKEVEADISKAKELSEDDNPYFLLSFISMPRDRIAVL